jgi:hypothetical protein
MYFTIPCLYIFIRTLLIGVSENMFNALNVVVDAHLWLLVTCNEGEVTGYLLVTYSYGEVTEYKVYGSWSPVLMAN